MYASAAKYRNTVLLYFYFLGKCRDEEQKAQELLKLVYKNKSGTFLWLAVYIAFMEAYHMQLKKVHKVYQ